MKTRLIALLGCTLALAPLGAEDAKPKAEKPKAEKPKGPGGGKGDGSFFRDMDKDGDKAISKAEAGERWERLGKLDKDGDEKVTMQETDVKIYKRELVREIKQSYYAILMADKAINIYSSSLSLVNENLRLNQSLLANGKGLPAYVSRAESEVRQVETQLSNAKNEKQSDINW